MTRNPLKISIITRYIIREHAGPFFFGLTTIVFVFLLNIVFRDLGRLLGKGLPIGVVLEFFGLNLAWIAALAIPMAVLISTLMTFGRLSSDSEIAALKASGIHLYRLITPVLINHLLRRFCSSGKDICVPMHKGRRGNPVVLGRRFYDDIMKIDGDTGARDIIRDNSDAVETVEIDHERYFMDVDTHQDYEILHAVYNRTFQNCL